MSASCRVEIINSYPPGQNDCHFADDLFRCIFNWQQPSIGLDIGLALNSRQAIIWNQSWPDSLTQICGTKGRWVKRFIARLFVKYKLLFGLTAYCCIEMLYRFFGLGPYFEDKLILWVVDKIKLQCLVLLVVWGICQAIIHVLSP